MYGSRRSAAQPSAGRHGVARVNRPRRVFSRPLQITACILDKAHMLQDFILEVNSRSLYMPCSLSLSLYIYIYIYIYICVYRYAYMHTYAYI